jgi:hypothetical protein
MKAKILLLGGVAIAAASIPLIFPASFVRADLEPDCAANPYGIDGQLSKQDLNVLFWTAFPQTAGDMRGRFGSPLCFDAIADYYQVEGTNHFIAVDYEGAAAVSWRAWELAQ